MFKRTLTEALTQWRKAENNSAREQINRCQCARKVKCCSEREGANLSRALREGSQMQGEISR